MKKYLQLPLLLLTLCAFLLTAFSQGGKAPATYKLPYKSAGLTDRQAAAHLLSRLTFGSRPGQVDEVVKMGLEKWIQQQVDGTLPDAGLQQKLAAYPTLKMSNEQMVHTYPRGGALLKMAIRDGVVDRDAKEKDVVGKGDRQEYRDKMEAYMKQKGFRPQSELVRELVAQKIVRATYGQNQLQEVLTSFWFNHFNVSLTKNDCAPFITAYERDVIRPNVLGKFETLLLATAKSPAMLTYLDNFKSSAANPAWTPVQAQRQQRVMRQLEKRQTTDTTRQRRQVAQKVQNAKKAQGLNENYAREVMELHTLGVDGGYTQSDVTQAARVFTGWTVFPMDKYNENDAAGRKMMDRLGEDFLQKQGFVREGDFVFAANRHDPGEKTVLGKRFPANGGYAEGQQLIQMLARHPATARFISTKLAARFVSDNPPKSLVDKMAKTFLEKDGDLKQVMLTMIMAPEFWAKEALREKTKSPFELAISSVRSLDAEVVAPFQLFTWITKMGEKLYAYQAPTGFPDKGPYWINTGSLLNRMNFGLALASGRIPGVKVNLAALNQNREPESAEAALLTYSQFLMPERDLQETIKRLTPALSDPRFGDKIREEADKHQPAATPDAEPGNDRMMSPVGNPPGQEKEKNGKKENGKRGFDTTQMQTATGNNTMLAQVVGIIIGSPEFQRR